MAIQLDKRYMKFDGDLLLTTACPVECDFCVYSCTASKEPWKWMPEKTIRRVAEEYSKNNIGIRISGGEPFYNIKRLERCIDILLEYYKPIELLIITSGFFGFDRENTKKYLNIIKERDFNLLVVSIDRFHQKKIPLRNIEKIIEVCDKMDIEIALRLSLDFFSFPLIDKISELIVKHKLPIETHGWAICGRAEKLDISPLKEGERVNKYLFSKIKEFAEKYDAPTNLKYYLTHTAKRSQLKYASEFFPTTFPNGNVYACSITMKGSYIGNINKENLLKAILKFKNTFPGYYMFSESNCYFLRNFLPKKFNWRCEFCRDGLFVNIDKTPEEALGREFIKITAKSDLNKLLKQLLEKKKSVTQKEYEREFLLSFRLSEKDLNDNVAKKIKIFLNKLKENKIRFALSMPLPLCLGIKVDNNQPKNCFECRELFTVQNGFVRYCEPLGRIKGHKLESIKDRNQIYEHFKIEHNKLSISEKCEFCLFKLRNQCNGMCFVKK